MTLPRVPQRTTPGFAYSLFRRSLQECLAHRKFGKGEIEQVRDYFFGKGQPECVYCGCPEVKRWDHLIPINDGGTTFLGNMVPSCQTCDDSKQHHQFEKGMTSDNINSPRSKGVKDINERINRIKEYVGHFGYEFQPLKARLNKDEYNKYIDILSRLAEIKEDIDALIEQYRTRTGHK